MQSLYGHRDSGIFGYSHLTGGFAGGQAEYVRVPKGDVNLLPIPDEVSDEKALYLSDVLCTAYHNVVDTGVKEGDVVGIWGLGPIGLCAAKWAKIKFVSLIHYKLVSYLRPEVLKGSLPWTKLIRAYNSPRRILALKLSTSKLRRILQTSSRNLFLVASMSGSTVPRSTSRKRFLTKYRER